MIVIVDLTATKSLFVFAWMSRMLLALMFTHWGIAAAMFLIGAPIDQAAEFTLITVVLFSLGIVGLLSVFWGSPSVAAKVRAGPEPILKYPLLVLASALASSAGGTALLLHGCAASGWWAIGLGSAVTVCESTALLGHFYVESLHEADGGNE